MPKIIVRSVRRAANGGVLVCAMLALVLQLFTSSMGYASNGAWIEICSDFGTEYVQVDLTGGPAGDQNGCPDCANCALCAATLTGLAVDSQTHFTFTSVAVESTRLQTQTVGPVFRRAWPETRGPPAANKTKVNRALGAFMASIQENGGAL